MLHIWVFNVFNIIFFFFIFIEGSIFNLHSYLKLGIELDTRGLSRGKWMFWQSKGRTWVDVTVIVVINELFINDNHCRPEGSFTFTPPSQSLPLRALLYVDHFDWVKITEESWYFATLQTWLNFDWVICWIVWCFDRDLCFILVRSDMQIFMIV